MPNTAEFMLNRLSEWGIERIYGYPGDGINGLLGAFHEVGDRIEFTQTAHEGKTAAKPSPYRSEAEARISATVSPGTRSRAVPAAVRAAAKSRRTAMADREPTGGARERPIRPGTVSPP